jgi:DivIVA domain-containing protein
MRALFRRFFHRPPVVARRRGTVYRSMTCPTLRPWQVRDRLFTPRGRRGVDAAEVADFLHRVADDLATLYAALGGSREETYRIKTALRQWQSRQARHGYDTAAHR